MGNDLNDIPECLGSLPTLRNLNLSENSLGRHYDPKKWSWMNCYQVTQSLETLDLSKNEVYIFQRIYLLHLKIFYKIQMAQFHSILKNL